MYQAKNLLKKILTSCIGGVLLFSTIFSFFVSVGYTQEEETGTDSSSDGEQSSGRCSACGSMPGELQAYINVMNEILALIPTAPETPDNILEKVAITTITAGEAALASIMVAETLAISTVGQDIFIDLKVLSRSEAIKRDWDKLLGMDRRIALKTYDTTTGGLFLKKVPQDVLKQVDEKLKKLGYAQLGYQDNDGDKEYNLRLENGTYSELMSILRQMNWVYKGLFGRKFFQNELKLVGSSTNKPYFNDPIDKETGQIDNEAIEKVARKLRTMLSVAFIEELGLSSSGKNTEYIRIDLTKFLSHVWEIGNQYHCADGSGNVCETLANLRKENKQLIFDRVKNDLPRAKFTVLEAFSRLKGALYIGSDEEKKMAQERKRELLSGVWGSSVDDAYDQRFFRGVGRQVGGVIKEIGESIMLEQVEPIKKFGRDIKSNFSQTKPVKKGLGREFNDDSGNVKTKYSDKGEKDDKVEDVLGNLDEKNPFDQQSEDGVTSVSNFKTIAKRQLKKDLLDSYESIVQDGIYEEEIIVAAHDTNDITKRFVPLSLYVHAAANIIGDSDSKDTTIYAASQICTNQCPNLNGSGKVCKEDHE